MRSSTKFRTSIRVGTVASQQYIHNAVLVLVQLWGLMSVRQPIATRTPSLVENLGALVLR